MALDDYARHAAQIARDAGAILRGRFGQPHDVRFKGTIDLVTEADQETKEITIENQKFVMPEEGGGASLFPQVGAEVTVFYREEGGQKVITRIGQAEE